MCSVKNVMICNQISEFNITDIAGFNKKMTQYPFIIYLN